jgi:hypothetical protein
LLCPEHRPYPCGTFNPERQLHRIEEAFGGAMTFPTEPSHIPACGIKSQGWSLRACNADPRSDYPQAPGFYPGVHDSCTVSLSHRHVSGIACLRASANPSISVNRVPSHCPIDMSQGWLA